MESAVKSDMTNSANAFESLIWPAIIGCVGTGKLLQMENVKDSAFAKILDMNAGIDGWQITNDGMRGIASRVQQGDKAWNTFTIRMARSSGAKTEFEKRSIAIKTGKYIYPYLTVQAYVKTWSGPVLSIGVARTEDIIKFIQNGLHFLNSTTNATFAVCGWAKMQRNGFKVKILSI